MSNVKRHHRNELLTLDKRLAAWHQVHHHPRSNWCQTAEWVYRTHADPDGSERTTRYRKSTALDDHYIPNVDVEVIHRQAHPVCVKESDYGVRPSQDHRVSAPILSPTAPDRVTVLHKEELWASDNIVAVSDGSLD